MSYILIEKLYESPKIDEYGYFDTRLKNKKLYWLINDINNKLYRCHFSSKENMSTNEDIINFGKIKHVKAKIT